MIGPDPGFERRVLSALEASPSRIPVVLGGCGTGRSTLFQHLRGRSTRGLVQYVDVERCATTPERFLRAVASTSPFPVPSFERPPDSPRAAFDTWLDMLRSARGPGGEPATFLLDEVLELRTFESFPGLRHVMRDLLDVLADSPNRFVLTTRYAVRARRWLREATARFEIILMPPLAPADVDAALAPTLDARHAGDDCDALVHAAHALTTGRAAYVQAMADQLSTMGRGAEPVSALTALLSPGGALTHRCHANYELRLHRARGYGALKAILEILADTEPLTLTEISHRLLRTPGSTKDYLSWLEDVDLVSARQKRYTFCDPVLRLWVRLYCRPAPPSPEEVVREVQQYAVARIPRTEPAPDLEYASVGPSADDRKSWGIIEID